MIVRFLVPLLLLPRLVLAAGFLTVYEDLPLPPALSEVAGSAFSFDSQDGRIVEAEAKGAMDKSAVLKFYGQALPELGWTQDGPAQFHREQDVLSLEFGENGHNSLSVRFKISPR